MEGISMPLQKLNYNLVLTVDPLAPDCTINCKQLPGNGFCRPAGTHALWVGRRGGCDFACGYNLYL